MAHPVSQSMEVTPPPPPPEEPTYKQLNVLLAFFMFQVISYGQYSASLPSEQTMRVAERDSCTVTGRTSSHDRLVQFGAVQ